jgi:FkbM family methyltransferase
LSASDIFIDAGAHAGYYTLLAAKVARRVLALEPNPANYRILRSNIILNHLTNVLPLKLALNDVNGESQFVVPRMMGRVVSDQGRLAMAVRGGFTVTVARLEKSLEHYSLQPDVIKIDVEGCEVEVVKGARKTLSRGVKLVVIEVALIALTTIDVFFLSEVPFNDSQRGHACCWLCCVSFRLMLFRIRLREFKAT